MVTTLTICKGCLQHAEGVGGTVLQERLAALQQRIEVQLGPVEIQLEECLHHCLTDEVCVRLDRDRRCRWTHVKSEETLLDPATALLKR